MTDYGFQSFCPKTASLALQVIRTSLTDGTPVFSLTSKSSGKTAFIFKFLLSLKIFSKQIKSESKKEVDSMSYF